MTVERINPNLPISDRVEDLNDMMLEVNGKAIQGQFDRHEIDDLYSGTGLIRKYKRQYSFGDAATGANAWYNWKHIKAESGYSIWEFDSDIDYEHNKKNEIYVDDVVLTYMNEASARNITSFDTVYVYDGSTYVDNTAIACSECCTAFHQRHCHRLFVYSSSNLY